MQRRIHEARLALALAALVAAAGCNTGFPDDDDPPWDDDAGDDDTTDDPDADGDGYPASVDCDDGDAALNWDDADLDGWSTCEGDCDDFDSDATPEDADGDGVSSCDGDCDDTDPLTYPGAPEQCDGADNDCDGTVDEDTGADTDGDGFSPCDGDCNDDNAAVHPGAPQLCDGVVDNDCDGVPDPNEIDADGDGYTMCGGDCDDQRAAVYPFAPDVCDGVDDNDCDGTPDPQETDDDGDGVTECGGDCDDADAGNFTGNTEQCDGADNDCSGAAEVDGDGVCGFWTLPSGAGQWTAHGWNELGSPHAPSGEVQAAFSIEDLETTWVLTATTYHVLDWTTGDWFASGNRDAKFPELSGQAVLGVTGVAAYWANDPEEAHVYLNTATTKWHYTYDVTTGAIAMYTAEPHTSDWGTWPGPDAADIAAMFVDLYNADGYAVGSPQAICGDGEKTIGPYTAVLATTGNVHLKEVGWCFEFYDAQPAAGWSVFTFPGAPPPSIVGAATSGSSTLWLFGPQP